MKTPVENSIKYFGSTFLALLIVFIWAVGCTAAKPTPNPLEGWKHCFNSQPDKAIVEDYQIYMQQLSPLENNSQGPVDFLEDGTGRHAIKFETGRNGTSWSHILIYDKDDKRIKAIKYKSGHYAS